MKLRKTIKFVLLFAIFMLATCEYAHAQAANCPQGMVCITPDAARHMLEQDDKVKALEAEGQANDKAIADLKQIANDLKVSLAKTTGELTGEQSANVQNRAIIDLLLKYARPKKFGVINF
jgi:hypothetical protein